MYNTIPPHYTPGYPCFANQVRHRQANQSHTTYFSSGDLLHFQGVVEQRSRRKVSLDELFQYHDALVGVVDLNNNRPFWNIRREAGCQATTSNDAFSASCCCRWAHRGCLQCWSDLTRTETHRLHPVTDTHDQRVLLSHLVDELVRQQALVVGFAELASGSVQRAPETIALII